MLANLVSVIIEILDFEGGLFIKMLKSIMLVGNILADIFRFKKIQILELLLFHR